MKNDFEIRGDVTAIILVSPRYGKMESLISTDKLHIANEYPNTWLVDYKENTKSFYVYGGLMNGYKRQRIYLHRILTNAPHGYIVDHINHDTLNNLDSNMRVITASENQQNRKGAQRNSRTGVRGVWWDKQNSKWAAKVRTDNKVKHIGFFESIEEAESAIGEARKNLMKYSAG